MPLSIRLSPPRVPLAHSEDLLSNCPGLEALQLSRDLPLTTDTAFAHFASQGVLAILELTPVEVFIKIFGHLDLTSAFNLAATSKRFASILAAYRAPIILSIVEEEFRPVGGLLQVVKARPGDLSTPGGTWLDKRILRHGKTLCHGTKLPHDVQSSPCEVQCQSTVLDDEDINRLLAVCKVVRGWERIYPQHRFHAWPLSTRSLNTRENERLRKALYTWLRYSYYFHGDLPRPNLYVPSGRDVRVNQLRVLSNSELRGLRDLWLTVRDVVELKLCPSIHNVRIDADFELSEKDAARIGWGEQRENQNVVATLCKLSPERILHYLDNHHTKAMLIRDIRRRHPHFEMDTESLSSALRCVSFERCGVAHAEFPPVTSGARGPCLPMYCRALDECGGGILDWDDPEAEEECPGMGEMTGFAIDSRPEEFPFVYRPEIPTGLLDP